jgi:arylsulfatase A-like enzyme
MIEDLKTNGELEYTLTIFTADHGAFFAGKGHPYEDGIRVPLFMHWPAVLRRPRTLDARVTHLDLLPTIASAAGVRSAVGAHGVSLDWLWGSGASAGPADDALLIVEVGYSRTVVAGEWKLIIVVQPPLGEHSPVQASSEDGSNPGCRTIHGMALPNASAEGAHRMRVKFLYDALERHPRHHCDKEQLYDLRRTRARLSTLIPSLPSEALSVHTSLMMHHNFTQVTRPSSIIWLCQCHLRSGSCVLSFNST